MTDDEKLTVSKLRPTLHEVDRPGLTYNQTYFRVLQAVLRRRGLIHGRLNNARGQTCAVGAYFREADIPIDGKALDEIASYNDSFPHLTAVGRKRKVMAWLKHQVKKL